MNRRVIAFAAFLGFLALPMGCAGWFGNTEGVDRTTLPDSVRPDYDLFALRCSKCHSLARPLSRGIVDDDYWALYVARMRRQPGSGISVEDTVAILRFLHYYSADLQKKKEKREAPPSPATPATPASSPPPPSAPQTTPGPPPPPPTGAVGRARGRVL